MTKRWKLHALWIWITCLASQAIATPLQDYLEQYYKNSPTLKAEASNVLAVKQQANAAGSYAPPEIGFEWGSKAVAPAASNESMYYGGITLGQEFMFPGKRDAMKKAEASRANMAQAEYLTTERNGAFRIAAAYLDIYMVQQRRQVLDSSLHLLASILESARRRFATGMTGMEDIFRLQAELARLHSDSMSLAGDDRAMQLMLCSILDTESSMSVPPIHFNDTLTILPSADSLIILAHSRSEVKGMASATHMAQSEIDAARLRKIPDMMLQGRYMVMMGPPEWALMVGFKIPIAPWASNEISSAEGVAKSREQEAKNREQAMRLMVNHEIREALLRMETAHDRLVQVRSEQLTTAESALHSAVTAYSNNKSDLAMSLDAARMVLMAKEDIVMAKTNWLQAILTVEKAAGVRPGTWLPESSATDGVLP